MPKPIRTELGQVPESQQDVHDLVKNRFLNAAFHVAFSFLSFGSLRTPEPPKEMTGFLGKIAYRLKGAEFHTTGKWQNLEVHAHKYLTPLAGAAFAMGFQKTAAAVMGVNAGISAVGNAMDSRDLYKKKIENERLAVQAGLKKNVSRFIPMATALGRFGRGLGYAGLSTYMMHLAHGPSL